MEIQWLSLEEIRWLSMEEIDWLWIMEILHTNKVRNPKLFYCYLSDLTFKRPCRRDHVNYINKENKLQSYLFINEKDNSVLELARKVKIDFQEAKIKKATQKDKMFKVAILSLF